MWTDRTRRQLERDAEAAWPALQGRQSAHRWPGYAARHQRTDQRTRLVLLCDARKVVSGFAEIARRTVAAGRSISARRAHAKRLRGERSDQLGYCRLLDDFLRFR